MNKCSVCNQVFSRLDNKKRHERHVHSSYDTDKSNSLLQEVTQGKTSENMTFQHPFSMVVSGPSGCGKTEWTRTLLLSNLVHQPPERIIWCFGQWQTLYDKLQRRIPWIEFVHGIPDYLNNPEYINVRKRNLIVFDDWMTEAKCDQRIADLLAKNSHHRNVSIIYFTKNLFLQVKACRDIALNTQYLVLFNYPIDRQQVVTLAKRIYPYPVPFLMKRFKQATSKPYGYLVIYLKSSTPEHYRLRNDIFEANNPELRKRMDIPPENQLHGEVNSSDTRINDDDDDDADENADNDTDKEHIEGGDTGVKRQAFFMGPPGKRIKEELKEERKCHDIWDRRFQMPLRHSCKEQFKDGLNSYIDQEYSFDEAYARTANDALPH